MRNYRPAGNLKTGRVVDGDFPCDRAAVAKARLRRKKVDVVSPIRLTAGDRCRVARLSAAISRTSRRR